MDTKKLIGAMVAAFVILFLAGFLVHNVWLGATYRQMRDAGFSFRPEDALRQRLWGIWVSDALYSILFVWVYAKGKEEKPWVAQGIRYGILVTLFTVVPSTINDYVVYNLPYTFGVVLDGRWPDYPDPDGARRRYNPEQAPRWVSA